MQMIKPQGRTILEAGFREEWRTGREEEILQLLRAGSFFDNKIPHGEKYHSVRKHLRKSVAKLATKGDKNQEPTSTQQNLNRALQLDKLLGKLQDSDPFSLLIDFVQRTRIQFSQTLKQVADHTEIDSEAQELAKQNPNDPIDAFANGSLGPSLGHDSNRKLLQLYENVADAKSKFGLPGKRIVSKRDDAFFQYLNAQRETENWENARKSVIDNLISYLDHL